MYQADPTSMWGLLRDVIIEKRAHMSNAIRTFI